MLGGVLLTGKCGILRAHFCSECVRMRTNSIESSKLTRSDVENMLIYPRRSITTDGASRELTQELFTIISEHPQRLEELGISRVEVFNPLCTDPVEGLWTVNRHYVWTDRETGIPLDSSTVRIEDELPANAEKMSRSELIEFLPPTYFRDKAAAERLASFFQAAGPIRDTY